MQENTCEDLGKLFKINADNVVNKPDIRHLKMISVNGKQFHSTSLVKSFKTQTIFFVQCSLGIVVDSISCTTIIETKPLNDGIDK